MKFIPRVLKTMGLTIGQGSGVPIIKGLYTGSIVFSTGNISRFSGTTVTSVIAGVSPGDLLLYNNESPLAGVPFIDSVYISGAGSVTIGVVNSACYVYSRGNTTLRYLWVDMT